MYEGLWLSRDRWFTATTVVVITIGLLAGALCLPPAEAVPSDTFTVGIHLKVYEIEMLLSTEEDTTRVVPGWVDMGNMLPGETVAVYISATGYQDMYATADPNYLRFEREGRQYFNLTVVLMEDAPIDQDFDIVVSAEAKTYLKSALSMVELHVSITYQLTATATLVSFPDEVRPGQSAKGSVLVTNTGSVYGEYELHVVLDQDSVAEGVGFDIVAWLTPGFYEEFDFHLDVADDAAPGSHKVTIELWAVTQYETKERLDSFDVRVEVEDSQGISGGTMAVLAVAIALVAALAIAVMLRRKA